MMSVTHMAIAVSTTSLVFSTANPIALGLAAIGSLIPDLDTSSSLLGQIFFPVSRWIEHRFPHRSITHSLMASGAIALLVAPFALFGSPLGIVEGWQWWCLPFGHLLACFADCFTVQGVQLFWPNPAWAISVSNPRRRLKTGGPGEYWVLSIGVALLLLGIYMANSGGLVTSVGESLSLRDTAIANYQKGDQWMQVRGQRQDRAAIEGTFPILAREGKEFVILAPDPINTKDLYLKSLKTVSKPGSVVKELRSFNDQPFGVGKGFVSGELEIDLPEDLPEEAPAGVMVSGSRVKLNYAPADKAIAYLKDQYVVGQVEVRRFVEN
jgi:inner membrane protein